MTVIAINRYRSAEQIRAIRCRLDDRIMDEVRAAQERIELLCDRFARTYPDAGIVPLREYVDHRPSDVGLGAA